MRQCAGAKIKKTQTCKPGSVLHSAIDLGRMSPSASCSLPPARMVQKNRSGAGSPLPFGLAVYLALQPMRCTAVCVTTDTGGLLPRLFTLVPACRDGHSLLHDCELSPAFPLGNMVPFVARTFLPAFAGRQNGLLFCKDSDSPGNLIEIYGRSDEES